MVASRREVEIRAETWPVRGAFRIARGSRTEIRPVTVTLRQDGATGRGECVPYARYGETVAGVVAALEALVPALETGLERDELARQLPAGAARNAIDCALWDLAAKRSGEPVWRQAGLVPPVAVTTAFTLSIDTPKAMAARAATHAERPLLKLKLAGDGRDRERVEAVHGQAPAAALIVDANEAWREDDYRALVPDFAGQGVALIEQPFPAGEDAILERLPRPVPVCADESCHDRASLEALRGRYDLVNLKLDKTGGLTEALALRRAAEAQGFGIMVGCMLGTSLAMAPAVLLAQGADYVDLDGPLLLAEDRCPGLEIRGSRIEPPPPALWG
ncbi:MAG: N-acetyl-D-Glu racemase DgcA [Candidatus Competibacterales bacterium]|nr:N-acetyl-D-Glu racemase DgcA [Candidatus Competibacterales bacterium]